MTSKSCCDLADFPLSEAPSVVYQIMTNYSCGSPFTAAVDVYCDKLYGYYRQRMNGIVQRRMDGSAKKNKRDGKKFKRHRKIEEECADLSSKDV